LNFYITLPRNSTTRNTQSNFTTYLNNPIELDGKNEVALSEISFSSNFIVNIGEIEIINPLATMFEFRVPRFNFVFEIHNGISLAEFVQNLQGTINYGLVASKYNILLKLGYKLNDSIIQHAFV
jgi:hypothetical protein